MKAKKTIVFITIALLISIICVASFYGVYKVKDYKVVNVIPDYLLGMEFSNSRVIEFEVNKDIESTTIYDKDGNIVTSKQEGIEYTQDNGYTIVETKVNPDEKLTKENYKRTKEILENRLKKLGVEQYIVKEDLDNGNIKIEMTENDNTDRIVSALIQDGTFQLIDNETNEVLLNTSNIKNIKSMYGQTQTGATVAYLRIEFNEEGKQKLEEISKKYIETTTQVTNENGEVEENTQIKKVAILINGSRTFNGQSDSATYFAEPITTGSLDLTIGSATNTDALREYVLTANEIAVTLNSGTMPIIYDINDYTVSNGIDNLVITIGKYIAIAIIILMVIYLIIKLRTNGIIAGVLQIGYIALLLIVLRYTNIKITLEGITGIVISVLLNYLYTYKGFKNIKQRFLNETTLKFSLKLIPVYIIAIIFTFNSIANISSLGMTLVWGIIVMYLYNLTLTQIVIKTVEEGQNAKK